MGSTAKIEGYRQALEEAGLEFDPGLIWEKYRCVYTDLIRSILDYSPKVTGISAFTITDHPIIIYSLRSMGYLIPEDISYVAWSCSDFSSLSVLPHVTGLDNLFGKLGTAAVRRLMNRIDQPNLASEHFIVDTTVRRGETCLRVDNALASAR